ncbi:uncharacterized protein Gasu_61730 [Galdieria sulphuraria]|uniref:Uncharacterized protein n=1 Tax=Galdieria sulphuraria TaxID=130081 RepID=M2VSQ5_GALSU|nr:uncharacterized protein Gasu_61730 [Galdieria sulphuraria]EME26181.1 hypothetical protein Gasu_61730 [Galdieria sulphuraria]|eukprot:XP_005702701.1 hypothetical protein Gasu_61730 [Galdieria sulphuraria]
MNLEIHVQGEAKASPLLLLLYQSKLSKSSLGREQTKTLETFETKVFPTFGQFFIIVLSSVYFPILQFNIRFILLYNS